MPRRKEKRYVVVHLSLDEDIVKYIDVVRGSMTRTEFVERILRQYIEGFENRIKELEQENAELRKKYEKLASEAQILEGIVKRVVEETKDGRKVVEQCLRALSRE